MKWPFLLPWEEGLACEVFSGLQSPADDLCESFPNCSFKETGTQDLLSPSHCLVLSVTSVSAYRAGRGGVLELEHLNSGVHELLVSSDLLASLRGSWASSGGSSFTCWSAHPESLLDLLRVAQRVHTRVWNHRLRQFKAS